MVVPSPPRRRLHRSRIACAGVRGVHHACGRCRRCVRRGCPRGPSRPASGCTLRDARPSHAGLRAADRYTSVGRRRPPPRRGARRERRGVSSPGRCRARPRSRRASPCCGASPASTRRDAGVRSTSRTCRSSALELCATALLVSAGARRRGRRRCGSRPSRPRSPRPSSAARCAWRAGGSPHAAAARAGWRCSPTGERRGALVALVASMTALTARPRVARAVDLRPAARARRGRPRLRRARRLRAAAGRPRRTAGRHCSPRPGARPRDPRSPPACPRRLVDRRGARLRAAGRARVRPSALRGAAKACDVERPAPRQETARARPPSPSPPAASTSRSRARRGPRPVQRVVVLAKAVAQRRRARATSTTRSARVVVAELAHRRRRAATRCSPMTARASMRKRSQRGLNDGSSMLTDGIPTGAR